MASAKYAAHREVLESARFLRLAEDEETLEKALEELIQKPSLRRAAAEEGLEIAAKYSPLGALGKRYLDALLEVAS